MDIIWENLATQLFVGFGLKRLTKLAVLTVKVEGREGG